MVFSSIPAYLDTSNWHQQQNHQIIGSTSTNPQLIQQPPQPQHTPPPQPHGLGSPGSIRPGSMSERARMANVQVPEIALKCPRCESTNTKFCYFNNYSLSQPRHFCKTCRRYWTRGGALRNVPVGGGCRRNKRSKSTSSKSSANCGDGQTTSSSTSSLSTNGGATAANMLGLTPPQLTPLRFMSPLMSQLGDHNFANELGLNYGGPIVGTTDMNNFHNSFLGGGGAMASLLSSGGIEPWRLQQFPFLGGSLDSNTNNNGMFGQQQFNGEPGFVASGEGINNNQLHVRPKYSSSMMSQITAVKMEESHHQSGLNLSRQMLGGGLANNSNNNDEQQQWNNNSNSVAVNNWTDLSGFSSCSTSNAL